MIAERTANKARGGTPMFRQAWTATVLALFAGTLSASAADAELAPPEALRLVSRQGHAGQVMSATLSADGSLALTTASDKQAILWDLATGRPLRHFLTQTSLNNAALSTKNSLVAVADGPEAVLWDARTGRLVARLVHHKEQVTAVDFSEDGKRLFTASSDGTAALWDLPLGRKPIPARIFPKPEDLPLSSAAMDRSAKHILTYQSVVRRVGKGGVLFPKTAVTLWKVETGEKMFELKDDKKPTVGAYLSPDGTAVITTHALGRVAVWDAKGAKIDEFTPPPQGEPTLVSQVGFGAGGRVLVAWGNDVHSVRDTAAKRTLWKFIPRRRTASLTRSAISHDGKTVVLWNEPSLEVYNVDSEELRHQFDFGFQQRVHTLSVSQDSAKAIAGFADGNAAVLDLRRSKPLVPLVSMTSPFKALAVTRRGVRSMIQDRDGGLDATTPAFVDWPLTGPVTKSNLLGEALRPSLTITRFALMDPTGDRLLTAGYENEFILWELPACKSRRLKGGSAKDTWVTALAFGPSGGFAVGSNKEAFVYHSVDKRPVRLSPIAGEVGLIAFTADGRQVFTRSDVGDVGKPDIEEALWDAATGERLAVTRSRRPNRRQQPVPAPAPAPPEVEDTSRNPVWDEGGTAELVVTNRSGPNRLLPDGRKPKDILRDKAGQFVALFPCWASAFEWNSPAVSPKGDVIATVRDRTVLLWDSAKKTYRCRCEPSQGVISSVAFRPDGKVLIGACRDALRAWEVGKGRELAVFTLTDRYNPWVEGAAKGVIDIGIPSGRQRVDNWLVATHDGRFDTGGIDDGGPFSWVFGDKPFHALPPEMFIRDYFEPGLLAKALDNEPFRPIPSPTEMNRAQPRVSVTSVTDGERPGTVDVTVKVEPVEGQVTRGGRTLSTKAVHDLRLLRNGQLVDQEPRPSDPGVEPTAWEQATRLCPGPRVVEEEKTGRMTVTFRGIQLPSTPRESVAFTAYAFNADRVKSGTSLPRTWPVPPAVARNKGRAYVICVGVGVKDSADPPSERFEPLSLTPDGAKRVGEELQKALAKTERYDKVMTVLLASNGRWEDRKAIRPTKGNIKTVLGLLAGVRDEKMLVEIPKNLREAMLDDVRQATPDDLVIIFYSGHGYSHPGGDFYLIPFDSGKNPGNDVRRDVLKKSISGQELSHWLRVIDAGETVLVVDSCNSGAVGPVKPAPLGDRGLGQLAYDKAMPVLAAVQPTGEARSNGGLDGYTLLAYTLAIEGLASGKAIEGGRLRMNRLLEFAAAQAPAIWKEKVGQEFNKGQFPDVLDFSHRKRRGDADE